MSGKNTLKKQQNESVKNNKRESGTSKDKDTNNKQTKEGRVLAYLNAEQQNSTGTLTWVWGGCEVSPKISRLSLSRFDYFSFLPFGSIWLLHTLCELINDRL